MNFLIGVELDFNDTEIQDDIFHMLVFFDTENLPDIEEVFKALYKVDSLETLGTDTKPINSLNDFFEIVFQNNISNIITIPHFNNKHRGIPSKDEIDSLVYTVFNALEDSNNRKNLTKSLQVFKKNNYNDVPLVVFSDNHNIAQYPKGKDEDPDKQTCMHLLGNIYFPFSSVKTAFQDVETRISIESVSELRQRTKPQKYIKSISFGNNIELHLSPYQNTIIGGFGSGKSFLLSLICEGKSNLNNDKGYKALAEQYEDVTLHISDESSRQNLSELENDVRIIKFDQYKDIYFENIILEEKKNILEKNLQMTFPTLEVLEKYSSDKLLSTYENFLESCNNTSNITDCINYNHINKASEKPYTFIDEDESGIYNRDDHVQTLLEFLDEEKNFQVLNRNIYSNDEQDLLVNSHSLIATKDKIYNSLEKYCAECLSKITNYQDRANQDAEQKSASITTALQIQKNIKNDIKNYIQLLRDVKVEVDAFEECHSKDRFAELKKTQIEKDFHSYKLIAKYKSNKEEIDLFTDIIKPCHRRDTLFKSIIFTIHEHGENHFVQNKTFQERVTLFMNNFYSNFTEICFDILEDEKSVLKRSAGEKANVFIDIIFSQAESYSRKDIPSIIILDQPEDNLDNKGIQEKVVEKIRDLKTQNLLPQLICVSHNPNISITADSENIILATIENGKAIYKSSGLEDTTFINEICNIVEGGKDALKRRGEKFNLPMIKQLNKGTSK